jgi:glucose/arabinose dehydrogenase
MRLRRFWRWALAVAVLPTPLLAADPAEATKGQRGPGVPEFIVRTGYKVTVALDRLQNARFMEFDGHGTLYVSQPNNGAITSFRTKQDGTLEQIGRVVTGSPTVHGMCFYKGWLWYTTSGTVCKGKVREDGSGLDEVTTVIPDGAVPKGGAHWWRSILVDDDGFYTSLGDPGNITDVDSDSDPLTRDREKIWHFKPDGSGKELFCSGIRNTEKLRFRPGTKEIWGCDHGSDNFGGPLGEQAGRTQPVTNMLPGDELNHYEQGKFYGHPFVVGNNIPRIEFQNHPKILELEAKTTPPAWLNGAHWANNGHAFVTKDLFPGLKGDLLIAFHGSWNDTTLVGYRIQRVMFDQLTGLPMGAQRIVSTLTEPATGRPQVLGRPVDLAEAPDGTILFSVDAPTGRIYRISPADK